MNKTKHIVARVGAQGEANFKRISGPEGVIPDGYIQASAEEGDKFIVAHSETGHHHLVSSAAVTQVVQEDVQPSLLSMLLEESSTAQALESKAEFGVTTVEKWVPKEAVADGEQPHFFLRVNGGFAEVHHERSNDTHAPLFLVPGVWRVGISLEQRPEGLRPIQD